MQSASLSRRTRGPIRISSLAYPRTLLRFKANNAVPDASRQVSPYADICAGILAEFLDDILSMTVS